MTNKETIFNILNELSVLCHLKGRRYIEEALEIILEKGEIPLVTRMYAEIAEKHNDDASRVERAIRHAIEAAFNNCCPSVLEKYFGNTIDTRKGKLTNSAFVFGLAEYIYVHNSKGDE